MRARFRAVLLLLAWPALTAQTTGKIPAPALQTQVQKAGFSISVDPETPTINKPAELRAKVTGIAGALLYEFDVDGIRQTDCSPTLSVCTWTPTASGEHIAHVVVSARPTAGGGRASGGRVGEARIPVKVQPQRTPTFPAQTQKPRVANAGVSISVDPETPTVNKPAELRAKVTEIAGTLVYGFDVDGIRQTDCSPNLSVCTWTPTASGEHIAHVVVSARPTAVSGRASGGSRYEARIPVKVQPPRTPTFPVQTPKPPAQNADVSISVDPETPTVNKLAELRAKVTGVAGNLRYVFDVDGARQDCSLVSSVCTWTPTASGEHIAHVVVSGPTAGGGRASGGRVGEARIPVKVQPPRTPTPTRTPTFTPTPTPTPALTPTFTPTPTPTPALIPTFTPTPTPTPVLTPTSTPADAPLDKGPDKLASPEIAVKLLSSKVVAGEPARFLVTLVNAKPFVYAIDLGSKDFETRTDAEFDHTFQRPGDVAIVARFPATGRARVEARLRITVEAPPTDRTWLLYVVVGTPLLFFAGRMIRRLFLPTATFLAVPDLTPRFDPSRSGGIALEVVYVPNVASLRYSPRVPIDPEP